MTEKAYIVTGPTAGIGMHTALRLARYGTIILVGRSRTKLAAVQKKIEQQGHKAVSVVCELSEPASVQRAAAEIIALNLPLAGLLNNAGMAQMRPTKNSLGWDMTFAANHLGPFALTEALIPHLPDGANILFVGSGTEDPERKPAVAAGFRGGRFLSVKASVRGEWKPGGSERVGADAYATSKQCNILTAMVLSRELPRLRINAVEPGFIPGTDLGRDAGPLFAFISKVILPHFAPHIKFWSMTKRAAMVLTKIMTDTSGASGIYYDDGGKPTPGSTFVRDKKFAEKVVAETREFLSAGVPA